MTTKTEVLTSLATIFALCAAPLAHASEPAQTAFDLLSQHATAKKSANYVKLNSSIDEATAMKLDARFIELYGEPAVSRAGLKVWEIANPNANSDQAKITTLMCGPDGSGGIYISADRRGLDTFQPVEKKAKARKAKPTTKKTKATPLSKSSPPSQQRD